MRLLICLGLFFTALLHVTAVVAAPDELEVEYREQPAALYQQLSESLPANHIFSSYEAFKQAAANQGVTEQTLFHSLYFLARLNLEVRAKGSIKHNEAQALRDTLEVIARTDYQRAAALNIKGRYAGLVEQHLSDTISLNAQALNYLRGSHTPEVLALKFVIYDDLGVVNLMTKRPKAALNNFKQMREAANLLRDPYLNAEAETRMAKYYRKTEQLAKALQHYNEAYRYSAEHDAPYQKAILELSLAKLYRDMQQFHNALTHVHKAIDLFRAQGSHKYLSSAMTVIAMIYAEQGEWNKAIDYYLNAQQFDAKYKSLIAQALNFHNLGEAYFHIKNFNKSLEYLHQANKIFKDHKSKHYLVYNDLMIAQVASATEQNQTAMDFARQGLAIAKQLDLKEEQVEALQYLVNAQEKTGDIKAAYNHQKEILKLNEAIEQAKSAQQKPDQNAILNEQNMTLKIQQQQQQLQQLQTQVLYRNIFAGLLILSLLTAIMVLLYLANQSKRNKQRQAALMQQAFNDPLFNLANYAAFARDVTPESPGIVLLEFPTLSNMLLERGFFAAKTVQQALSNNLNFLLNTPIYSIGAAQFAFINHTGLEAAELHRQLCSINLDGDDLPLNLALINLPLLADEEVILPTDVLFETLQWLLAGARSTITANGCYLGLRVLEFTPSTVFSQPLYLQLGQSIRRGFIRIDSNVDKSEIKWPDFQTVNASDFTNVL